MDQRDFFRTAGFADLATLLPGGNRSRTEETVVAEADGAADQKETNNPKEVAGVYVPDF